jgi:hypothetical protein
MLQGSMFLRSNRRMKDGKEHRYYTVVESRRLRSGKVAQRQVLYLGEINDSQQAGWRKTLEVFDEEQNRLRELSLFGEDRPAPADAISVENARKPFAAASPCDSYRRTDVPAWRILASTGTETTLR